MNGLRDFISILILSRTLTLSLLNVYSVEIRFFVLPLTLLSDALLICL